MPARRPLLHATDFSAASRPAFAKALELAKAIGTDVVVAHVLNAALPVMSDEAISPPTYEGLRRAGRTWANRQLDGLIGRARSAGVRATPIVCEGNEAAEIARLARSRRASMIVLGTHGRTGLKRALLGSVAARVLTLAPCPVLTVPAR